jgi:leucyl aminopeptidase
MQIVVSTQNPLEISSGVLILPLFSGEERSGALAQLDKSLDGLLSDLIENDGFKAKTGENRLVYTPNSQSKRLLLLGLGEKSKFSTHALRKAAGKSVKALKTLKKTEFAFVLPDVIEGEAQAVSEGLILSSHSFDDFKSGEKFKFETVTLVTSKGEAAQAEAERAELICKANLKARYLVNLPSNLKSPEYLARQAEEIAQENGFKITVWDESKILEERMGALYGVGMGSDNKPRFIVIEYAPEGTENDAPIALVGKGMTFDSGGYSIKPAASMEDMKDDMAGAALVLGVMSAVKPLGIKKRILGIIASAENMVSSNAQRPGDIVTARNGKTIEVLNTDAEGRLILADALSWACEQNPAQVINFATLTGAIVMALGQEGAGLFSNNDELSSEIEKSGLTSNEKLWRFPLWEDYDEKMKGTVSDLKNISGERGAGSIVAAVFLREFVTENTPWAHLDIAGVSLVRSEKHHTERGATGFGVRLMLDYLSR